jgi:hypothetical protein
MQERPRQRSETIKAIVGAVTFSFGLLLNIFNLTEDAEIIWLVRELRRTRLNLYHCQWYGSYSPLFDRPSVSLYSSRTVAVKRHLVGNVTTKIACRECGDREYTCVVRGSLWFTLFVLMRLFVDYVVLEEVTVVALAIVFGWSWVIGVALACAILLLAWACMRLRIILDLLLNQTVIDPSRKHFCNWSQLA